MYFLICIFLTFITERKRDTMYSPKRVLEGDAPGSTLKMAQEIFEQLRQSGNAGLTYETFGVCV